MFVVTSLCIEYGMFVVTWLWMQHVMVAVRSYGECCFVFMLKLLIDDSIMKYLYFLPVRVDNVHVIILFMHFYFIIPGLLPWLGTLSLDFDASPPLGLMYFLLDFDAPHFDAPHFDVCCVCVSLVSMLFSGGENVTETATRELLEMSRLPRTPTKSTTLTITGVSRVRQPEVDSLW